MPDRRDIVWLDFEPAKGGEIGNYRPALVLSSHQYNRQTGLIICCPISTSIRGVATEVPVPGLQKPSVVSASIVQTLSWRDRQAKKIVKASRRLFDDVLVRLLPLIGAAEMLEKWDD